MEDDQYISRVYTRWLQKCGINVIVANNGGIGLDILQKQNVDLVLLDLGMPGLNGIETLRQLRKEEKTKDLKVIVISNTTMTEDRAGFEEIQEAGVLKILRKYETSLADLLELLEECFDGTCPVVTSVKT